MKDLPYNVFVIFVLEINNRNQYLLYAYGTEKNNTNRIGEHSSRNCRKLVSRKKTTMSANL